MNLFVCRNCGNFSNFEREVEGVKSFSGIEKYDEQIKEFVFDEESEKTWDGDIKCVINYDMGQNM
jgi:hypothetical protein